MYSFFYHKKETNRDSRVEAMQAAAHGWNRGASMGKRREREIVHEIPSLDHPLPRRLPPAPGRSGVDQPNDARRRLVACSSCNATLTSQGRTLAIASSTTDQKESRLTGRWRQPNPAPKQVPPRLGQTATCVLETCYERDHRNSRTATGRTGDP